MSEDEPPANPYAQPRAELELPELPPAVLLAEEREKLRWAWVGVVCVLALAGVVGWVAATLLAHQALR